MVANQARISVRVYPGAAGNKVTGFANGVLLVKISAPPVGGKANRELVAFLSRLLNVSQDRVNIVRGNTSRRKLLSISGLSWQTAIDKLFPGYGKSDAFEA
ncbi:MAG: DUF167 domain-containing protein [Dehalococcoidales bacterium]